MPISLFSFNFRLGPWEGCLNLNFDQEALAPGFQAVCTRDQLSILWTGDPQQNETARAMAYILARTLVHADAFVSYPGGIVLDVEPVTWLEVREHVSKGVVSGYMHQTLVNAPLDPNHPDKARLRSAAALVRQVQPFPALQLALGDLYTARREIGPYSAFYAFRVLEDVGFHFGVTNQDKPDWKAMNAKLGTTEAKWKPLTSAGTAARHLSVQKLSNLQTINVREFLDLARESVELALRTL
jgi:hypothetical protein